MVCNIKRKGFIILLLVVIAGACLWFYDRFSAANVPNVVIISIDTCRADYLSCYGNPSSTTPNIDAIANQGVLFENAISPVPLTLPSHSSMMTGTIPPSHGVHDNKGYQLGDSNITLAEILKEKGFTTGAIVSAFVLDSAFGMDQGFETYNDSFGNINNTESSMERSGSETSRIANSWLQNHRNDKFFLFLHYFDPHFPYESPKPFAPEFQSISKADMTMEIMKQRMAAKYAAEISYTDHCIGLVVEKLKKLKLFDSTLIIITSDHGEMLQEHGENSHGFFIYQSAVKVPLIFKLPGKYKPARINNTAGLIDIAPTVCSLLDIDTKAPFDGVDLQKYLSPEHVSEQRNIYCETFLPTMYDAAPLFGVVSDDWKYIQSTRPELYDLRNDPKELSDISTQQKQRSRLLQGKIKEILEQRTHGTSDNSKLDLDKESMAKLKSLGYVASDIVVESFEFDPTKKDPKDLIKLHSLNSQLSDAFVIGDYPLVRSLCKIIMKDYPTFMEPYFCLGTIAFKEKDYEKTVEYFSRYVEHESADHELFNNLGLSYIYLGNHIEAVKSFEKALQLEPDSVAIHFNLGKELLGAGDLDQAISHFNKAIELAPEADNVRHQLDRALKIREKTEKPLKHYSDILEKSPDSLVAHYNLANVYLIRGKKDIALQHCIESLKSENETVNLRLGIVSVLLHLGEDKLAFSEYNRILDAGLESVDELNSVAWLQGASTIEGIHDPGQAVEHAMKACQISEYANPETIDTLAVAYAASGEFEKAIETALKAINVAKSNGKDALAGRIGKRLELYRQGKVYVDIGLKP